MKVVVRAQSATMCKLSAALCVLLAIFPLAECAEFPNALGQCDGTPVDLASQMKICMKENQNDWVWIQGKKGFGAMAVACCDRSHAGDIERVWTAHFKSPPHPLIDKWYPIPRAWFKSQSLKPQELNSESNASKEPQTRNGVDLAKGQDGATRNVVGEIAGAVGETEGEQLELPNHYLFFIITSFLLGALLGGVILFAAMLLRRRNPKETENLAEVDKLAEKLADSLAQALRQVLQQQRILIEMVPPQTFRLAEWDLFLNKLKESPISPSAPAAGGEVSGVGSSVSAPTFQPMQPISSPTQLRVNSGGRRYVKLTINYDAGAKALGGNYAFEEIENERSGFYVEAGEGGAGWLYPNPEAREVGAVHENLFNLRRNDFPLKLVVEPKLVRRKGGLWILDSQI